MSLYLPMAALDLVRKAEGLRLEAYLCPAGKWTIGYGHTGPEVTPGLRWTREQADNALLADMLAAAKAVDRLVTVPLTTNQRGALASFVFNLGASRLASSTLLKLLNAGDMTGAIREFPKWSYATVNGKPQRLQGLVTRREAEQSLFVSQ